MNQSVNLASELIRSLREYGEVDIDFLARLHGQRRSEINEYLQGLQEKGVVEVRGARARLTQPSTSR